MWHLLKIPQTLHLYWGGHRLSYLRYLTVRTFRDLNPGWQVKLHLPNTVSDAAPRWQTFQQKGSCVEQDYLDRVDADIVMHDFSDYGFDNQAHEVHKSDFLRWRLLAESGGIWSDMDILYVRPMDALEDNVSDHQTIDTVLCPLIPPKKHTVGFLMSGSGNAFCRWMHQASLDHYDPEIYQCMGSNIINQAFESLDDFAQRFPYNRFLFLDPASVYSVTSKDIDRFYQPMDRHTLKKLNRPGVIGFHWFGGHPLSQNLENQLTENNLKDFDCFLTDIIKRAMT